MNKIDIPWKETLVLILLLLLTISMNYLYVDKKIINILVGSEFARFVVVFAISFATFSFTFNEKHSLFVKIAVSLVVALFFHFFISHNAVPIPKYQLLNLENKDKKTDTKKK